MLKSFFLSNLVFIRQFKFFQRTITNQILISPYFNKFFKDLFYILQKKARY